MTGRKRTLIALLTCVIAVLGLTWSLVAVPILDDLRYGPDIRTIPAGESIEFEGHRWTIAASGEIPGKGVDADGVPADDAVFGAILAIEPLSATTPEDSTSCDAELTDPATGRVWDTLVSEARFGYQLAADSTTTCLLKGEPLRYETVFLTPLGAYEAAVLDVVVTGAYSTVLRFELGSATGG